MYNAPNLYPPFPYYFRGTFTDVAIFFYVVSLTVASSDPKYVIISTLIGASYICVFFIEHLLFRPPSSQEIEWIKWGVLPVFVFTLFATIMAFASVYSNPSKLITLYQLIVLYACTYCHIYRSGKTLAIAFGFACGLLVIWYIAGASFVDFKSRSSERFRFSLSDEGEGMNPNTYGIYLVAAGWFLLREPFRTNIHQPRWLQPALLLFTALCLTLFAQQIIFTTGSRKSQLGLLILVFMAGLMFQLKFKRSQLLVISGIIATVTFTLLSYQAISESDYGKRFDNLIRFITEGDDTTSDIGGRTTLIKEGLGIWANDPIIGNGYDAARNLTSSGLYTHSNYVELLANLGLVGFLLYYWTHFRAIKMMKEQIIDRRDCFGSEIIWLFGGWFLLFIIWDPFSVTYTEKINYIILATLSGLTAHFASKNPNCYR